MSEENRSTPNLTDLDERSRMIFREIVETYLDTGDPVGSRTLSRRQGMALSPASIRNTMSDLAAIGLLTAPHQSAGRLPTHAGLRLFVDGLLQVGEPAPEDRDAIESRVAGSQRNVRDVLSEASSMLAGLAGGAGLVTSPSREMPLKHVEFVPVSAHETLAILVGADGSVENRMMIAPDGLPSSALIEAGNYLSARLKGRTLKEAADEIRAEMAERRAALDEAAQSLVEQGLADWSGGTERALIVRGQAQLLDNLQAAEDLERVRLLFDELERKEGLIALLDKARDADGVRLFIGAENPLFSLSGSSMIVAPYMDSDRRIIGALGVIGPTRLNYARVIPMVDYTARVVGRLLDKSRS
ncbi:heat-inducible transcriptional repressor HrcA [Hyphobacterium sp.]|jgi:heat-inducible transcriptional repressor|uniref:heat-inducible transcriptional repressor HrcA n=1 Tax=Hyphobacterium sp. TaxID=2004662 RepID=UPI003BA94622